MNLEGMTERLAYRLADKGLRTQQSCAALFLATLRAGLLTSHRAGNEDFDKFDLPILTIIGYYERDQPGAMEYYRRHMKYGTAEVKAKHFLLLGPWDHSGTHIYRQTERC